MGNVNVPRLVIYYTMSRYIYVDIIRRGEKIGTLKIKQAWIPLNYDTLLSMDSALAAVAKTGSIIYYVLPLQLRQENSTRPVPKKGDVLLMPQHRALGVALEDTDPPPFPATRAGEVSEGLSKLAQLKPGDVVILKFKEAVEEESGEEDGG